MLKLPIVLKSVCLFKNGGSVQEGAGTGELAGVVSIEFWTKWFLAPRLSLLPVALPFEYDWLLPIRTASACFASLLCPSICLISCFI